MHVQYPDLTEVVGVWQFPKENSYGDYSLATNKGAEAIMDKIHTEFAFMVATPEDAKTVEPERWGWKRVATMNNWYPGHYYHKRPLVLFFWQRPADKPYTGPKPKVAPQGWLSSEHRTSFDTFDFTFAPRDDKGAIKYDDPELQKELMGFRTYKWISAGGCGFKLGTPPLRRTDFARYFTLLRMPITPTKKQLQWLEFYNYRKLGTGTMASYWANGWKPDEYTEEKEDEFFLERGISNDAKDSCKIYRPIVPWQHRNSGVGGQRVREGVDLRERDNASGSSENHGVSVVQKPFGYRNKFVSRPKTRRKIGPRKTKSIVNSGRLHNKRPPKAIVKLEKKILGKESMVREYDTYYRSQVRKQAQLKAQKNK